MSTRAISSSSTGVPASPSSSLVFDGGFDESSRGLGGAERPAGGPSGSPNQGGMGSSTGGGTGSAAVTLRAVWKRDEAVTVCERCSKPFTFYRRRHHCRRCGGIFCADCAKDRTTGISGWAGAERICKICQSMAHAATMAVQPRERHVVILGSPGVGKSTIAQMFASVGGAAGEPATSLPGGPSAGASNSSRRLFKHRTGVEFTVVLEDTIGQAQVGTFPPALAIVAHAFLLVFSFDDRASLHALRTIHQRMLDCGCYYQPTVVAGTSRSDARVVTRGEAENVAQELGARLVEVPLTVQDVGGLFERVLDEIVAAE